MSTHGESTPQRSSSLELSSPPHTPPYTAHNGDPYSSFTSHPANPTPAVGVAAAKAADAAPKRRKKKDADPKSTTLNGDKVPVKRPRAPRGTGPRAMKKKLAEEAKRAAELAAAGQGQAPQPPPAQPPANHPFLSMANNTSQTGNREAIQTSYPHQNQTSLPFITTESRPSSGQNYDPIRSSTVARHLSPPANILSTPPKPTVALGAARSPSISSLIDHPDPVPPRPLYPVAKRSNEDVNGSTNEIKRPRLTPPDAPSTANTSMHEQQPHAILVTSSSMQPPNSVGPSASQSLATSMSHPVDASGPGSKKPTPSLSKGPSPTSHSPKPVVARKEAPVLPAAGSGLLTGSIFGTTGNVDDPNGVKSAPTVVIHVSLAGKEHHTVNFTRLAEEKYGFDALHPRLAAQRERLARVAAAGAALERAQKTASGVSIDEMSEDLSNDEGDQSNVEINGIVAIKSGDDVDKPARKKRVMKEDMYDVDDDFIDDTEQAWEEQAAVSKDGFFVYSGPLVPEGQEAKVERAETAPRRGRGGGRGSRGGGAGRGGRAAANKDNKEEKEVKRRVRRSKEQIERDRREAEEKKAQKERQLLLASKPSAPYMPLSTGSMEFQPQAITH